MRRLVSGGDPFKGLPRVWLPEDQALLSRDLVRGRPGRRLHRHHHHGRRHPLCQVENLQVQR